MYSNYLYDDRESGQFVDVTDPSPQAKPTISQDNSLKSLFSKFSFDNASLIPLLILAFLLFDADEDERLIIIALALFIGL